MRKSAPSAMNRKKEAPEILDGTQSIRRAVGLMKVVGGSGVNGTTLARAAAELSLSRSTAHRILQRMVEEQLLRQDRKTQRYHIGPLTFELGASETTLSEMVSAAHPTLERIAQGTGATVYLVGRSGYDAVCLDKVESTSAIRAIPVEVGQRRPLGIGAGSITLLAKFTDDEIQGILQRDLRRYAKYPFSPTDLILEKVKQTRATGFSATAGMAVPGVTGIGYALPSMLARPVLAISVAAVTAFVDRGYTEKVKSVVLKETASLSRASEAVSIGTPPRTQSGRRTPARASRL